VQEAVPLCLPLGGEGGVKFDWMAFWSLDQSLLISSTEGVGALGPGTFTWVRPT